MRAIANRFGARITLISVVPPVGTVPSAGMPAMMPVDTKAMECDLRSRLEVALTGELVGLPVERVTRSGEARRKIESLQRSAGVEASLRIAVGQIVDKVTEEARQEEADLILIGRGSLQSASGRLRTHAYGIIQKAPARS